ncbi:MAG: transposase [Prevotellaceae bacterium]|nr:transposase [Prevotellaceae bacterium]
MFNELILNGFPALVKFFNLLDIQKHFTKPQVQNMQAFIIAMLLDGFNGKMTDVSGLSLNTTRTSVCHFLNTLAWNDNVLLNAMQSYVVKQIWDESKKTGNPIYVIIDDTIAEKSEPWSQASCPTISGCGFHRSHLNNKTVYGHQFVTVMLQCGDLVLPYDTILYDKKKSKIQIAKEVILSLPYPVHEGFVLTDSWYSCEDLFKTAKSRHFQYIGGLKTNRLIYPKDYAKDGIQIQDFVRTLTIRDFDLVTIKGHKYWVYTYIGKIKGLKNAKVVISYPKDALFKRGSLNAFVCTQVSLSTKEILNHYTKRWPIEVFFREANRRLGMKKCQVRSSTAIRRYQYMVMLCYIFCGIKVDGNVLSFSKQRLIYQESIEKFKIQWIFEQAEKGSSLSKIFAEFRWPA